MTKLLRKNKKTVHLIFVLIISLFFQVFLLEFTVRYFPRFDKKLPYTVGEEKFDPALGRLNSVESFLSFCDSLYGSDKIRPADSASYANIVARVLRYRFVHGYTWYRLGHNYVATLLAPLVHPNLSAIVVPDDILKYPSAACSQQSIVSMELMMEKGYRVRKVGFYNKKFGGHFCYEVWYKGSWHFYDPNREPDEDFLLANDRPGIERLNANPLLLKRAYPKDSTEFVTALYSTYKLGIEGRLPGQNARLFQQSTKFLSFSLWIILGLLYLYFEKRLSQPRNK